MLFQLKFWGRAKHDTQAKSNNAVCTGRIHAPPPQLKRTNFFLVFKVFYIWIIRAKLKKSGEKCDFGHISAENDVFLKKKWKNQVLATENA